MVLRKALCLALMFCVIWRRASAIGTKITINPESLVLDRDAARDGDTVTVDCEVTGTQNIAQIYVIWISRTTTENGKESLASVDSDNFDVPKEGMTATGGIDEKQLKLTMPKTKCEDAGNYTCSMTARGSGISPDTYESTETLHVEVSPGPVTLTATQNKQSYTVNETLLMLCNGPVGTVNDDTQVSWVWKYKDTSSPNSVWQPVDDSDAQIEDVLPHIKEKGDCYEVRKSRLTRILTLADSKRMYQCVVRRNNQEYPQFADNYTINSVTEEASTTTASTPGGGAKKSNIGGIVGGIVGALVAIIVVTVIVVFVIKRRKRSQGDDYASDDAGNQPADDPNGAPFTTGPGVMYSAQRPNRNNREAGENRERERGGRTNADGLHYADLDLVRKPPQDDSTESVHSRTTPTEYASIKLY